MKICVIDLLTTGPNPEVHEIISYAATLLEFFPSEEWISTLKIKKNIGGDVLPTNFLVDPSILNFDEKYWKTRAITLNDALKDIYPLIADDVIIAGNNPYQHQFFLKKVFEKINWSIPDSLNTQPFDITSSFLSKSLLEGQANCITQTEALRLFAPKLFYKNNPIDNVEQLVSILSSFSKI